MDLKSILQEELWESIESTYLSENFSHAITDAIIYLTNILRQKGDTEGIDGVELVNQTLSPNNPKIKLNQNLTKSDKQYRKVFIFY